MVGKIKNLLKDKEKRRELIGYFVIYCKIIKPSLFKCVIISDMKHF